MGNVNTSIENGIATIELSTPGKKNALNQTSWTGLRDIARSLSENKDVRVVIIKGNNGDFSSGADLSDPEELTLNGLTRMRIIGDSILEVQKIAKPTIAQVEGVAVGAGMGLALACDLVIASKDARFCQIFVKRGLSVDGGSSWILPRLIGLQKSKELAFFGDMLSADDAFKLGIVNKVVDKEEINGAVEEWAQKLSSAPTFAISLAKSLINTSFSVSYDQALENEAIAQSLVFTTSDFAEAMSAFIQRRDPIFKGF